MRDALLHGGAAAAGGARPSWFVRRTLRPPSGRTLALLALAVAGTLLAVALMPRSRDFGNYESMCAASWQAAGLFDAFALSDPTFVASCRLTQSLLATALLLGSAGLMLKLRFFATLGGAAGVAVLLYFARFFIVHDVTQLRASFGIALLGAGYLALRRRRGRTAVLLLALAAGSHVSTLALMPAVAFAAFTRRPQRALRWALAVLLAAFAVKVGAGALIDLASLPLDAWLSEEARLVAYVIEEVQVDVPPLATDLYLFVRLGALAACACMAWPPARRGATPDDWHWRCGIVLCVGLLGFVLLHDYYTIAARLAELAAPFECAVVAAAVVLLSRRTAVVLSPPGAVLVRWAVAAALAAQLLPPQFKLLT